MHHWVLSLTSKKTRHFWILTMKLCPIQFWLLTNKYKIIKSNSFTSILLCFSSKRTFCFCTLTACKSSNAAPSQCDIIYAQKQWYFTIMFHFPFKFYERVSAADVLLHNRRNNEVVVHRQKTRKCTEIKLVTRWLYDAT